MKLSREIKTGIIVLTGILAVVFGLNYLKSSSFFEDTKTLYAVYDHVGGLQPGTQVTINGLAVGNVNSIRFKMARGNFWSRFPLIATLSSPKTVGQNFMIQVLLVEKVSR